MLSRSLSGSDTPAVPGVRLLVGRPGLVRRSSFLARHRALIQLCVGFLCLTGSAAQPDLSAVLRKDTLRVLITDSGLGGLAVAAEVDSLARATRSYQFLDIVFCNALPESDYGYNNMTTREEQSDVFNQALSGMVRTFDPDMLLIACNTLSVVYPSTDFADTTNLPVVDIVSIGVGLLEERLRSDTTSMALLFGTEITISSGAHIRLLEKRGISASRVVVQSCGELASEIQLDAESDMVGTMIDLYVQEAASTHPLAGKRLLAGLVCTHYGYRSDAFADALRSSGAGSVEVVDPNHRMSGSLFPPRFSGRAGESRTEVRVYSRALLSPEERASIGALIRPTSPQTADALSSYVYSPTLFDFSRRTVGADGRN